MKLLLLADGACGPFLKLLLDDAASARGGRFDSAVAPAGEVLCLLAAAAPGDAFLLGVAFFTGGVAAPTFLAGGGVAERALVAAFFCGVADRLFAAVPVGRGDGDRPRAGVDGCGGIFSDARETHKRERFPQARGVTGARAEGGRGR